MRRPKTAVLSLGIALGAAAVWAFAPFGSATGAPPQAVVAVVDILKLCEEAPGKAVIDAKRKASKDGIDTWMTAQKVKLSKMEGDANIADNLTRREKQIAFEREKMTTEFDGKAKVSEAMRTWADSLAALYDQVRGAINAVATQKGYTLVLYKPPEGEPLHLDEGSQREFILNVAMRPVLHSSPELDITQDVLAFLQAQRPPTPPVVPPAMDR